MDRGPLDVDRLRDALLPRWTRVEVVAETASTNTDLLADIGAPDRSVLVAEHQVSGRGRVDRAWVSPPRAGITVSVLLRPQVPVVRWGWLALLSGVALCEAVTQQTGVDTALKWPNDLIDSASGRKLAGILAQTTGERVVIGIGLNVSTTPDELPVDTAISLTLAGARSVERTTLLAAILGALDTRLAQWSEAGGDAAACGLDAAYRQHSATLGTPVRVTLAERVLEGDAVDIDEIGRLVVGSGGQRESVSAGDVEQLRPA